MAGSAVDSESLCDCVIADKCEGCKKDAIIRAESRNLVKPHYTCTIHKSYKEYQEHLLNYKNWCIVLNLPQHPPVPLLLGCQLELDLDILLHWYPHCLLCYTHCCLHSMGQSHQLCCHQWSGWWCHCWHVSLVNLGQYF